jgi:YggT family protein
MFVLAYLIDAVADVLSTVLYIYMWIVIVAALLSWVNPDPYNPIVRFLYSVTEPAFAFVRRHLPLPALAIDISPIIVWLAIYLLLNFIPRTLHQIALGLQ